MTRNSRKFFARKRVPAEVERRQEHQRRRDRFLQRVCARHGQRDDESKRDRKDPGADQ